MEKKEDRIVITRKPRGMRAGIRRLAAAVAADFGRDPMDGALCCFVSRDLRNCVKRPCMLYERMHGIRLRDISFPGQKTSTGYPWL